MKRTAKILFSTMLVLMFVFSFAGAVPALAANGESTLSAQFYSWTEGTEGAEGSYAAIEGSAVFGNDEDEDPTIADLRANGVSVKVPEGLYVASVQLSAKGEADDDQIVHLNKYALLAGDTLTISADAFADDELGVSILDELSDSEEYVLSVYFRSIDPVEAVEVTRTDGALEGQLFDEEAVSVGSEGYAVPSLGDELKQTAIKSFCKEFAGWKLIYENGISTEVTAGSVIHPYMDAELEAQWNDVIVIQVNDASKTYDGSALVADYSVYGKEILESGENVVAVLDENSSITNAGSVTCSVASFSIDGAEDGKYTVYTFPGTLTVNKVKLEIVSPTDTKTYDGQALTNDAYSVNGSLVGSDKLEVTVTGSITDVGEADNTFTYTLENSDNYDVTETVGKLSVTKRSLTVTTGDASADYTGAPLTESAYTVEGLVDGQKETVTFTGAQTVPGSSANNADVAVKNGDTDVTANYSITVVPGTLTVNTLSEDGRIALTIAPKAVEAEYDGTAHSASEYEIVSGKLPEGVTLDVTYSGERTDAGEGEASIASVTLKQDDTDVTENFDITLKTGKITVSQRPITITAESATKEYDGKALVQNTAKITEGSLLSGHKVTNIEVVGTQTEVGTSKNTIKENSVKITDASGSEVTRNYAITLKDGKLEVTGKAVTDITVTASATKVYDGTALELTAADIKVTPALPSGYTISATFSTSSRTDAGKDDITLTNIVIKDASGNDVSTKFNIKVEKGTLEVTARPLTVTTGDKTKVYDGTALTDRTVPTVEGQLSSHNIELKFTGTQTKVGSSDNSVQILSIKDKETKADVTSNYTITYNFGKLTVTAATSGNGSGSNSNTVETGDSNNIWIWVVLMVVAAAAVAAVVIIVRRNKKNGDDPTAPNKEDQNK